jgi:hypothetical protein
MIHLRIAAALIEQQRTIYEIESQLLRNARSRGGLKLIASCACRKEQNRVVKSFATKRVATRTGVFERMFRMRSAGEPARRLVQLELFKKRQRAQPTHR